MNVNSPIKYLSEEQKCVFKIRKGFIILKLEEIFAVESFGAYSKSFTTDQESYVLNLSLKLCQEEVKSNSFLRVHDSHIINVNYVKQFENNGGEGIVTLINGETYKVSRSKKKELFKLLGVE